MSSNSARGELNGSPLSDSDKITYTVARELFRGLGLSAHVHHMPFAVDDGGRRAAGFQGSTGDCVTRAIAIAARVDYGEMYREVRRRLNAYRPTASTHKRSPRNGVPRAIYEPLMVELGFTWHAYMKRGTGVTVHVRPDELPTTGRHVLRLSKHVCALVDGVVHDTSNPCREGTRAVYGMYTLAE